MTTVPIKPTILEWAIRRAGFHIDDFIEKFPKVKDWLTTEKEPTVKQLEDFSKRVHLPFGYLLLDEPPEEKAPIPFFRTKFKHPTKDVSLNTYDTILLLQRRQDWLREYLMDSGFDKLQFVGKYSPKDGLAKIVNNIRKALNIGPEWAQQSKGWSDALDYLTEKIEDIGITVVFNGVVDNNTSRPLDVNECRGFVLVDEYAPFLFINNADAKAAQMFTLAHEIAHIWLGQSAGFDNARMLPADDPLEKMCDQIAAELLVPAESFDRAFDESRPYALASVYKVSPIVILRRALDLKKISRKKFFELYNAYINLDKTRKETAASGGDFYATTRKRLSSYFAAHIDRAIKSNKLLYRDAYTLTGLKGDTFKTFFDEHLVRR